MMEKYDKEINNLMIRYIQCMEAYKTLGNQYRIPWVQEVRSSLYDEAMDMYQQAHNLITERSSND